MEVDRQHFRYLVYQLSGWDTSVCLSKLWRSWIKSFGTSNVDSVGDLICCFDEVLRLAHGQYSVSVAMHFLVHRAQNFALTTLVNPLELVTRVQLRWDHCLITIQKDSSYLLKWDLVAGLDSDSYCCCLSSGSCCTNSACLLHLASAISKCLPPNNCGFKLHHESLRCSS